MQSRILNQIETKSKIQTMFLNQVKCSKDPAEHMEHRAMKFNIANWCWGNDINFATEVIFKNNQRADIVLLDWGIGIEVLHSERKLNPKKKYPLPVIPVSTKQKISQVYEMLNDLRTSDGNLVSYYIDRAEEEGLL